MQTSMTHEEAEVEPDGIARAENIERSLWKVTEFGSTSRVGPLVLCIDSENAALLVTRTSRASNTLKNIFHGTPIVRQSCVPELSPPIASTTWIRRGEPAVHAGSARG
jgi:hypothetical protein